MLWFICETRDLPAADLTLLLGEADEVEAEWFMSLNDVGEVGIVVSL